VTPILLALMASLGGVAAYAWWWERAHRRAAERLSAALKTIPTTSPLTWAGEGARQEARVRAFPPRYRWAFPIVGAAMLLGVRLAVGWPIHVAAALAILASMLVHLLEETIAEQRLGRIEMQLADTIDLVIASLRAGAALTAALEAGLQEAQPPLRPYLQEIIGRLRLGDTPREVIGDLAEQVPTDTFRLFALALVAHWEVGGSLAATLATVARTIRDRIELGRRVRALGIEANVSVVAVLLIAYLLGFLMWRAEPARMEAFLTSPVGSQVVSLVIALQAIGLMWMSRISRGGA
jgi:tight adherence protein B